MKRRGVSLLLLAALALGGCDLSMKNQARDDRMGSARLWKDGPARQPPPEGTVAQDDVARMQALAHPPPLTRALVDRGQERYEIYCLPCHGERGEGDGPVVQHGFPAPPSYWTTRLEQAPPGYVVDVISHGYGVMYSYADRVEPKDRWAIAAYVKALQVAGRARERGR
ncbi:cytochrome c [Novosphingobium profundi]|uniref:c-type cytochrome n=1 Tax=Novosphingobium profundi TaxID=1774954 RepID=UPI001BDA30F0|nr:cytochrome c [Novosphingobium profundi]MBT0667611.1 cytochrome c [Novosphingobium profundi]